MSNNLGYIVQNVNIDVRMSSASGGAFTALAQNIINKGGIVYGAVLDDNLEVCHKRITRIDDITSLRGSKYVQSNLKNTFSEAFSDLQAESLVLFSGTPCQIAGLKSYLRKEYDNLYTVSVACKGVASNKFWEEYKAYQESKYKSKIENVKFRDKHYGYSTASMALSFEYGKNYYKGYEEDPFLFFYVKEMISRPSCSKCYFKIESNPSDIVIFDCWHIYKMQKEMDDNKGTTSVIVKNLKGKTLLTNCIDSLKIVEHDWKELIDYDGIMLVKSFPKNSYRDEVFMDLNSHGIEHCIKKYMNLNTKVKLKSILKVLLYKLGMLNKLKRIKGK
ncbi:coenzyme F420-reducing hydrogenase beta subunit [Clostridium tetanomorphum]|uniref:Coenzyme F420 hydrogenase/dehydrogenase, beta subunit C-terminal domain n=1 Tax=Clostridium tetanomorphum TaxID=1553 RepID=UPI00044CD224|nr:Coenzyme F420 hydrogenase/dehydrogenase, beta subunit C-terminal domain [Clostridium tetanomorphum]KAJ49018.1 coenzyme F420-reducing hydrogenase subunit beta [Clostridium tetanomorphum DSM 665]KAJ52111.1 coenzyme F420-reducing hydrogenase subunit beta [Clostridium tetanomorphum DSM 665]MBP1863033.1 coenzyme F420-reducing hydrogenase beta subunit [Clostridium tetanomorphum]NRS82862.1 coenzyme F420-reducing hydrogenase beta subunit [Clostridium tetanomorphum]SQC03229.1 coenzyme F420-reducing 